MEKKNVRASNFSAREENILINLVKKYKNEIECKKSDTDTNKIKAEAWLQINREFNSILGDPHRSAKVLKNKYENIKKRGKQKFADNKKYVIGTGGGPFKDLVISNTESDLHEILGTQLTGLTSKFDSDAAAESIIIQIEGNNNVHDYENLHVEDAEKSDAFFDNSQIFSAPAVTDKPSMTIDPQIDLNENSRNLSFSAPFKKAESSMSDWTKYTPAMLKKPLSASLQHSNNKDTPKKCQTQRLSAKLEDWAKSKSQLTGVQERAFIEQHEIKIQQMQEKHDLEMGITREESRTRMRFLEKEHNLRIEILEKELQQKN